MDPSAYSRFGSSTALVADGLPEWPESNDLTAWADAQLAEVEAAYLAEFERLAADDTADIEVIDQFAQRIQLIREDAARRFAAAAEPPAATDPPAPVADPPAPPAPALSAEDRAARLAALRTGLAVEPAVPAPGATLVPTVTLSREDIGVIVAAGAEAGARAVITAMAERPAPPAPAPAVVDGPPVTARGLGAFARAGAGRDLAPHVVPPISANARLVSAIDVPNRQLNQEFTTRDELVKAFQDRHLSIGTSHVVDGEKVPVAIMRIDVPEGRDLRGLEVWRGEMRKRVMAVLGEDAVGINPWTGKEALIASGGLAAPVEPYYPQFCVAQSDRPVLDALPGFVADRGGIKLVLPASIGTLTSAVAPGTFTDGVTNTDTSFTSATATFTAADLGSIITGAGIPSGTVISTVTNSTTLVLSKATTATATGVTFNIAKRNPNNLGAAVGLITAAQDAASPSVLKSTYDVPDGTQAEFDVYSVYTSLQYANLTARTFPEQVELNIRLADALAARTAETALLDGMTNYSTLLTGAKTFGTARQLLAQFGHLASYYRNHNRMNPEAILRLGVPAWSIDAMRADYLSTFIGGGAANWGLSNDEIAGFFQEHALMPFLYWDGPTDVNQLFVAPGSGAINTGTNSATPVAIPDYPGSGATTAFRTKVVSYLFAEGTWLALTTGELNLGLVRDSILNSQNRFRNFQELWEAPAFVGVESLRCVHTVAADGTYGAAASITLGAGSGL